jgi:hypothetical protein
VKLAANKDIDLIAAELVKVEKQIARPSSNRLGWSSLSRRDKAGPAEEHTGGAVAARGQITAELCELSVRQPVRLKGRGVLLTVHSHRMKLRRDRGAPGAVLDAKLRRLHPRRARAYARQDPAVRLIRSLIRERCPPNINIFSGLVRCRTERSRSC